MLDSCIHFNISRNDFDNSVCEYLTSYSSYHMSLLYLFYRYFNRFVLISCLQKIPLCGISGVLKVTSDFMSPLNNWVIFAIRNDWEIPRFVFSRSHLIVNPKSYFSGTVDQVANYFLMYSIVSINYGWSPICSIISTYTVTMSFLNIFTFIKR